MRKIAFLGSGNMASAMVGGILARGLATPQEMITMGGQGGTAQALAAKTGIGLAGDAKALLSEVSTLVVAFKPQHLAKLEAKLATLTEGKLIVSVLAGKTLAQLREAFPKARALIRCMPNTPSRIGAGMTGWCADPGVTAADRELLIHLLDALGKSVEIPEEQMDALTAVSGSGPAYVFEFAAALRDAGISAGLSPEVALSLSIETLLGAAKLLSSRAIAPETLRDEVTSPNGVTFAGLKRMSAGDFRGLIAETVATAKARSKELSSS
jgi:pyrroline-5-carboxylate reductase